MLIAWFIIVGLLALILFTGLVLIEGARSQAFGVILIFTWGILTNLILFRAVGVL